MKLLDFKIVSYSSTNLECACVTGGGGCSCDDGTGE